MSKPLPLEDFRAVRIILEPKDFAYGSEIEEPALWDWGWGFGGFFLREIATYEKAFSPLPSGGAIRRFPFRKKGREGPCLFQP